MLMKTRAVDFHHVDETHHAIDKRLANWADWVVVRCPGWISPMFRMARSNSRQWHTPEIRDTCDILDAAEMEKAVCKLPSAHRDALRWCYVYRFNSEKFCKMHGVNPSQALRLLNDARQMLINRGV